VSRFFLRSCRLINLVKQLVAAFLVLTRISPSFSWRFDEAYVVFGDDECTSSPQTQKRFSLVVFIIFIIVLGTNRSRSNALGVATQTRKYPSFRVVVVFVDFFCFVFPLRSRKLSRMVCVSKQPSRIPFVQFISVHIVLAMPLSSDRTIIVGDEVCFFFLECDFC
jgi:hypothetical protein